MSHTKSRFVLLGISVRLRDLLLPGRDLLRGQLCTRQPRGGGSPLLSRWIQEPLILSSLLYSNNFIFKNSERLKKVMVVCVYFFFADRGNFTFFLFEGAKWAMHHLTREACFSHHSTFMTLGGP